MWKSQKTAAFWRLILLFLRAILNKFIPPGKTKRLQRSLQPFLLDFRVAERRGFEPLKPFRGLLAFQAGQFNHSCIFPKGAPKVRNISRFCK